MIYNHECEDDQIAYFKVDVNLIDFLPDNYLGNVWKMNDFNFLLYFSDLGLISKSGPEWGRNWSTGLIYASV